MSIEGAIAERARRQHGLVTAAQLSGLADRRHLDRRVSSGQLVRVNHHVYRVAAVPVTWESTVLAAVMGAPEGTVASHLTAAALWGLPGYPRRARPEISIPRGAHHRPSDALCHTSSDLDRCDVVLRDRIPTTDLARTLLDLGRHVGIARLDRAVEHARRQHGLAITTLVHALLRHARQGRHGIRRLRRVVNTHADRTEVTDSDFELLVLSLIAERGLPAPVLHHPVHAGAVLVAEVDLAWPQQMVAVELQGQHHRERQTWEIDQVKTVELQALGWTVLPFTWRVYVDRTEWMVRRIREAITISAPA